MLNKSWDNPKICKLMDLTYFYNAELALVKLMELFNHSSVAITKRYLGLRQEELLNTYDCLSFWLLVVALTNY